MTLGRWSWTSPCWRDLAAPVSGLVELMPVSIFSLQLVIAAQDAQDIGRWLPRKRRNKVNPTGQIGVNRTAIACPPDGLTLSGQKLKAALRCLKETGLMRLLEPKKLLAVSRPLSDLQRVNLVFFDCRLLELEKLLTPQEQSFVGHQKQRLDGLIGRIESE